MQAKATRPQEKPTDAAYQHRLVCHAHMECVCIDITVHSNRLDAKLSAGPHHAASNFTTVRDEDLVW
jgi:hypothetical protein